MVSMNDAYQQGYDDGYRAALIRVQEMEQMAIQGRQMGLARIGTSDVKEHVLWGQPQSPAHAPRKPRKVSAYHKRLGREIKRLRRLHITKAGKWKKGWNQKRLMKTAHKNTK